VNIERVHRVPKSRIKLIIIDLYGVMSHGSYKDTCKWLAKKYKRNYPNVYKIVYHKYFNAAAVGKISEQEFYQGFIDELGLKENWKAMRAKHLSFQTLNKQVLKLTRELQAQGYKILLLSKNIPYDFIWTVKKFSLRRYFKHIINTYDLGLPKASPKTMKYVLRKFKVKPHEVVFVDDQPFNLPAAQKMGVSAFLYKNFRGFRNKLERFL
jgi:FMN phosphatase YigB (HAD superfamily)